MFVRGGRTSGARGAVSPHPLRRHRGVCRSFRESSHCADPFQPPLLARGDPRPGPQAVPCRSSRPAAACFTGAISAIVTFALKLQSGRAVRKLLIILILLGVFLPGELDAAKRRVRRHRRKAAPVVPAEVAVGRTLEERLASLVNGKTASS